MGGYNVEYVRIPTTPEKAPEFKDMNTIMSCLKRTSPSTSIVFNCQMGRGRTTTGMVLACLYRHWKNLIPQPIRDAASRLPDDDLTKHQRRADAIDNESGDDIANQRKRGEYQAIVRLLQLLSNGQQKKQQVDFYINLCNAVTDILDLVNHYKQKADTASTMEAREANTQRALICLRRYMTLIIINHYLANSNGSTLSEWLEDRKELTVLLDQTDRDPQLALQSGFGAKLLLERNLSQASELILQRSGDVLTKSMILLSNNNGSLKRHKVFSPIQVKGVERFFKADGQFRVYHVASPSIRGIEEVIYHSMTQSERGGETPSVLTWISSSAVPMLYVNERAYVLRDASAPCQALSQYEVMPGSRIRVIEQRLKNDVLDELKHSKGELLLHTQQGGIVEGDFQRCKEDCIDTVDDIFERNKDGEFKVNYHRAPLIDRKFPDVHAIDQFLDIIRSTPDDTAFITTNKTAMVIACLYLKSEDPTLLTSEGDEDDKIAQKDDNVRASRTKTTGDYSAIHHLIRVLPDGVASKERVDAIVDACTPAIPHKLLRHNRAQDYQMKLNIRDCIELHLKRAKTGRNEERRLSHWKMAVDCLKRYFMFIVLDSYMESCREHEQTVSFAEWIHSRSEIKTLYDHISRDTHNALARSMTHLIRASSLELPKNVGGEFEVLGRKKESELPDPEGYLIARNGHVLTSNSILKVDHFPGCQRRGMDNNIEGAPNFRQITNNGLNVYGTAMPTIDGIYAVLGQIGVKVSRRRRQQQAHTSPEKKSINAATAFGNTNMEDPMGAEVKELEVPGSHNQSLELANDHSVGTHDDVTWVNLREEPILYINRKPYVLRNVRHPFTNLEHTGISRSRVEEMEQRFKEDVLNEISNTGGYLLLHEETNEGDVVPVWEMVSGDSVRTPADVYANARRRGFNIKYVRIPITDEQAPLVSRMEKLVEVASNAAVDTPLIFNCQMGRGRTTTGMVVACMTRLWKMNKFDAIYQEHIDMQNAGPAMFEDQLVRLKRGNYKVILSLMRVLHEGAKVKIVMDSVIDTCSIMQNLREAIFDYKCRSEIVPNLKREGGDLSPTPASSRPDQTKQRKMAHERGIHYLRRYFMLLVCCGYLMESMHGSDNHRSFAEWVDKRTEFGSILDNITMN
eukprot:TRINITY_DN1879_c1_g3_i2.p1 TRINITY_DN1879_c1_g3~~TRINITY_DN1879_c1_g3_i2.p1  ORF type:complete len:1139 (-),score=419.55 TRINITY_DN1879_c1_g3_i2:173-3589(-)